MRDHHQQAAPPSISNLQYAAIAVLGDYTRGVGKPAVQRHAQPGAALQAQQHRVPQCTTLLSGSATDQ